MAISRSLMNRQLQANGGIMQVAPRENFGAGTDTIRDYALGMNSGNGPITRKDYIDIYLFAGYDSDVASSLGDKHYKSGIGQDSNTQGFAAGGVVSREKFGLGSKLKSFVRKIIPNEIADIAVKAAPFVAPFNPAVGAAMSGLGRFDQTGSIGDSLKGGALTYGLGQGARYLGGAGFQGNPFAADGGAFRGGFEGFTQGFSSPLGTDTGLGKFFSNRGTSEVQAVQNLGTPSEGSYLPFQSEEMKIPTYSEQLVDIQKGSPNQMTITQSIQKILSPTSTMGERGNEALNLLKRGTKAAFTKSDGKGGTEIDKAAVLGAATFAASYAEAKALAADAGVEITEEQYDEAKKADKKEEYAGYLTNFFAGKKDGGRIGFADGTPDKIIEQFYESNDPDANKSTYTMEDFDITREPEVVLVSLQGPDGIKLEKMLKSDAIKYGLNIVADSFDTENLEGETIDLSVLGKKDGGRIGRKFGSPEEGESEVGIMTIDVEAGDDEDEDMEMAAGISFNSAEKSYLFRKLGGGGGASRSFTMPQLYRILNNPGAYPNDAKVLKELTIGLGLGKKDGGRIGYANGSDYYANMYSKYAQDMINDGNTPMSIEDFIAIIKEQEKTSKAQGGRIMFADGTPDKELEKILATSSIISDNPNDPRNMTTDQIIAIIQTGRSTPEMFEELMLRGYTGADSLMVDEIGGKILDKPQQVYSFSPDRERGGIMENFLFDLRENNPESYGKYNRPRENLPIAEPKFYRRENLPLKANGGRIKLAGGSGSSNRVAQLILERDYLLSKDEDVSYIDAELASLGYKMKSEGGVMEAKIPTGQIRKNNVGVIERDYRDEGGFVPVGIKERADDVPAMLSKNEFVMTADAVRGIGNGSVEEGSKKLYKTMKQAEKVGKA